VRNAFVWRYLSPSDSEIGMHVPRSHRENQDADRYQESMAALPPERHSTNSDGN
jgi:hypothetical protein